MVVSRWTSWDPGARITPPRFGAPFAGESGWAVAVGVAPVLAGVGPGLAAEVEMTAGATVGFAAAGGAAAGAGGGAATCGACGPQAAFARVITPPNAENLKKSRRRSVIFHPHPRD